MARYTWFPDQQIRFDDSKVAYNKGAQMEPLFKMNEGASVVVVKPDKVSILFRM